MIGVTFKSEHEIEKVKDERRLARKRLLYAAKAGLAGHRVDELRLAFRYYDSLYKELRTMTGKRLKVKKGGG